MCDGFVPLDYWCCCLAGEVCVVVDTMCPLYGCWNGRVNVIWIIWYSVGDRVVLDMGFTLDCVVSVGHFRGRVMVVASVIALV